MSDELYYRHVYHILSNKVARVGGLPFVTIPQGVAAVGGLGIAMLQKSIPLAIILPALGFVALSTYQGEFAVLRLAAVLYAAVLIRLGRPKVVSLEAAWKAVGATGESRPAAIYHLPGASVVAGKEEG